MKFLRAFFAFARRTWAFFVPYGLWLALAGLFVLAADRGELHLTLNTLNVYGGDAFYRAITWLGDRRVAWAVGLLLCFRGVRQGVAVLAAVIAAGLATEALKYGVYGPMPRPVAYFGEPSPLYLVPGFENKLDYTMPSGHAAIAFALFTSLALQTRVRSWQLGCIALALTAAYSRVHLSEHFLHDVYAGSLLGVLCGLLAHAVVRPLRRDEEAASHCNAPAAPVT